MGKSKVNVSFIFVVGFGLLAFQNCAKVAMTSVPSETPVAVTSLTAVDKTCALGSQISIPVDNNELHCSNLVNSDVSDGFVKDGMANFLFPKKNLVAQTVPNSCLQGVEINNLINNTITLHSLSSLGTSNAITLEVDYATYMAPDSSRLVAQTADGKDVIIFDSCHLRTACYGDPTGGKQRPYEDSIRSFSVDLPKGTVALKIDHSGADTPTYIRILGLCEFDLSNLPPGSAFGKSSRVAAVFSRAESPMGTTDPMTTKYQY